MQMLCDRSTREIEVNRVSLQCGNRLVLEDDWSRRCYLQNPSASAAAARGQDGDLQAQGTASKSV